MLAFAFLCFRLASAFALLRFACALLCLAFASLLLLLCLLCFSSCLCRPCVVPRVLLLWLCLPCAAPSVCALCVVLWRWCCHALLCSCCVVGCVAWGSPGRAKLKKPVLWRIGRANKMDPEWCRMRPGQGGITPTEPREKSKSDPADTRQPKGTRKHRGAAGRDAQTRAHTDLNQGPADLQSAALTTELCTRMLEQPLHHINVTPWGG